MKEPASNMTGGRQLFWPQFFARLVRLVLSRANLFARWSGHRLWPE